MGKENRITDAIKTGLVVTTWGLLYLTEQAMAQTTTPPGTPAPTQGETDYEENRKIVLGTAGAMGVCFAGFFCTCLIALHLDGRQQKKINELERELEGLEQQRQRRGIEQRPLDRHDIIDLSLPSLGLGNPDTLGEGQPARLVPGWPVHPSTTASGSHPNSRPQGQRRPQPDRHDIIDLSLPSLDLGNRPIHPGTLSLREGQPARLVSGRPVRPTRDPSTTASGSHPNSRPRRPQPPAPAPTPPARDDEAQSVTDAPPAYEPASDGEAQSVTDASPPAYDSAEVWPPANGGEQTWQRREDRRGSASEMVVSSV